MQGYAFLCLNYASNAMSYFVVFRLCRLRGIYQDNGPQLLGKLSGGTKADRSETYILTGGLGLNHTPCLLFSFLWLGPFARMDGYDKKERELG
jgi:hypothetical protein